MGLLALAVGEAIVIGLSALDGDAGGEVGGDGAEILAGAGGDDEVGEERDLRGAMPLREGAEAVGADEEIKVSLCGEGLAEMG